MTRSPGHSEDARRRSLAPAALVAVYLISGLLGNLHMVLVDHHSVLGHAHEHHHHAPCPDAEWTPSDGCGHHHELADHDVVSAHAVRSLKDATSPAALPGGVAPGDDHRRARAAVEAVALSPSGDRSRTAPIRAPPADLLSV